MIRNHRNQINSTIHFAFVDENNFSLSLSFIKKIKLFQQKFVLDRVRKHVTFTIIRFHIRYKVKIWFHCFFVVFSSSFCFRFDECWHLFVFCIRGVLFLYKTTQTKTHLVLQQLFKKLEKKI